MRYWKGILAGLIMGAVCFYAHPPKLSADAAPTYIEEFNGTGANHNTRVWSIDYSGNVFSLGTASLTNNTVSGTQTNSGPTVYTPASDFLTNGFVYPSTVGYVASNVSFALVYSTGSINFLSTGNGTAATPFISTATAVNGQYIIVGSTQTTLVVSVSTGINTAIAGDDSAVVFSSTKNAVGFIFSSALSQWVEVGRQ